MAIYSPKRTVTMNPNRFPSTAQIQRKRKERDDPGPGFYTNTNNYFSTTINKPTPSAPNTTPSSSKPLSPRPIPVQSNRFLAGYMAHEFLTKGTILGQKFDPARAEAVPLLSSLVEPKQWPKKPGQQIDIRGHRKGGLDAEQPGELARGTSYAEVAAMLKMEGTHIPGVFNPTELAKWIQK